jgi:hypothetical protein
MMLVQPLEEATRIASRIAKASPSGTVKLWRRLLVPAAMKEPVELRIHQPQPVAQGPWEKLASTLHFHHSGGGCVHRVGSERGESCCDSEGDDMAVVEGGVLCCCTWWTARHSCNK